MKKLTKISLWIIGISLVLIIFVSIIAPEGGEKYSKEEIENLSYEEKIAFDIMQNLGESNREVDRLRLVDFKDPTIDGKGFMINFNANDNLKTSWIRDSALDDTIDLLELIFTKHPEFEEIGATAYFPLSDQYGNSEDVAVIIVYMSKETADKINWDNFYSDNLKVVADDIYIHQALNG